MLPTTRTTFPQGLNVNVPCYQVDRFDGKILTLTPEGQELEVNCAHFNALSLANATAIQPEGWELQGLIAVDSWPFAQALQQASAEGTVRRFGMIFDDVWYQAAPINRQFTPHLGQYVVVGLYR